MHTKLICSDEGNYSIKHLISGEEVTLTAGAEYEIRHSQGAWRLQEVGVAGLGMPLGHLFIKQLRFNETTSFIELFDKKTLRVDAVKPESLVCDGKYLAHTLDGKIMRIKVYLTPWPNPGVWYEMRRFSFYSRQHQTLCHELSHRTGTTG